MNHVIFRSLTILLLLCSIIAPTRAQNESQWPPNADDVFVPGIEVLEFNMLNKVQQSPLGQIAIIPEYRVIKGADGRVYPWPESVPYFQFTYPRPLVIYDVLYLYQIRSAQAYGDPDKSWTLNLKTGIYTEYRAQGLIDTPCGKVPVKTMDWDLYYGDQGGYLCTLRTGERITFPAGYHLYRLHSEAEPVITTLADGRLVVVTQPADEREFTIMVSNLTTKAFDIVGTLPLGKQISANIKYDNIIVYTIRSEVGTDSYGVFNVRKNSLAPYTPPVDEYSSFSTWDFWPNPTFTTAQIDANGNCVWLLYDLETNKESSFNFGDLCYSEFTRKDGTSYFRQISPDKKTATVIRFNPLTNERQEVYSGEIEGVIWVSDDGRYIMLVIDNDGKVDTIPTSPRKPYASSDASLKFIDLQYNITRWQTPAYINQFTEMDWEPFVDSRIPNWLLVQESSYTPDMEDTLIHVTSDGIKIRTLNIQSQINNEWASYQDNSAIGLYHLDDEQRIPIFNIPIDKYVLNSLTPLGDNRFQVKISYSNWPKEDPPDQKIASFIIRVPNINLPIGQNIPTYLYFEETS